MSGGVASSSKPPIANTRARDYAISDAQEPELRSASELSAKKVQKINKELTKLNSQLVKDMDALKKEKEMLLAEKQKLKSDNKTLERELRKVSSKGDIQRLLKNGPSEADPESVAEQRLQERDQKISALKRKIEATLEDLQQSEGEKSDQSDEVSPQDSQRRTSQTNGKVWESVAMADSALQKENLELKSRVASLEAELEQLVKNLSPKNSRIKSGNFFRRSKRSAGDIQKEKLYPGAATGERPRSPDIPLSDLLTFDTPSSSVEGTPIHKSLPAHISPNNSPKFDARDLRNNEIQALKSRLKSADEERKRFEEQNQSFEAEIRKLQSQLEQLQVKADEGRKASEEVERVKRSLKLSNSEKLSLSGQVQHLRKEVDELKVAKKTVEKTMNESLKKKENRIEELESECRRAKMECEKLQRELQSVRGSAAEVKMKENKIEDLELECNKTKAECQKLRKELESTKTSLEDMKKKLSRMDELEAECTKAKKECEKLQKQLEPTKSSVADKTSETKVTTPPTTTSSGHAHTAAKPPSGARLTSPSHSISSKPTTRSIATTSTTLKQAQSSANSTASDDSVFEPATQSNNSSKSASETTTQSRLTRKSSGETVERRTSGGQSRSRDSSNPPRLVKRRSSTELIELFEHPKETPKPADTVVKRNTSYASLATSNTHRAKVAATRAMFEGKNGEETTAKGRQEMSSAATKSMYRRSWTSDLVQCQRSSYTDPAASRSAIPEGKETVMSHSKSQSVDATQQFKATTSTQVQPSTSTTSSRVTASVNSSSPKRTAISVAPSKPASLNLGSTASVRVNSSQQHSVSSTPSLSSTPNSASSNSMLTPTSAGGSKVSKITFKSSSSPSTSPKLNTRREVNEVTVGTSMKAEKVTIPVSPTTTTNINYRSTRMTSSSSTTSSSTPLRSPTTPLKTPTTPLNMGTSGVGLNARPSSVVVTSSGVPKSPSYVPSYVRSNTVMGTETASRTGSKVASEAKAPVTRSQTAVTFTVTSAGARPQAFKTNVTAQPQPEQGILKRGSSVLGTPTDIKKASSLLDIAEEAENSTSGDGSTGGTSGGANLKPTSTPTDSVNTTKMMHTSPVPVRVQRRKREERPKTMYVGANRSETVSLVRLISKYQEQERREKGGGETNTGSKISAPASTQVPAVNGNASPTPAAATTFSGSTTTTSAGSSTSSGGNSSVGNSQPLRRRPQTYYGGSSSM